MLRTPEERVHRQADMRRRLKAPVSPRPKCVTCCHRAASGSQYCPVCVRDGDRLRINAHRAPPLPEPDIDRVWAHYEYIEHELFGPPGNIGTTSRLLEAAALE